MRCMYHASRKQQRCTTELAIDPRDTENNENYLGGKRHAHSVLQPAQDGISHSRFTCRLPAPVWSWFMSPGVPAHALTHSCAADSFSMSPWQIKQHIYSCTQGQPPLLAAFMSWLMLLPAGALAGAVARLPSLFGQAWVLRTMYTWSLATALLS